MNHAAHILHRDKILDAHFAGARVHADFGNVNGPRVAAVGIPLIFLVVPMNVRRRLIPRGRFQRAMLFDKARTRRSKFFRCVFFMQRACRVQLLPQPQHSGFDQLADDHRGARGNGRPAIGHQRRIRTHNFNLLEGQAQCIGSDLRENGIGALADFRIGHQHAHAAFARRFSGGHRGQIFFAGTGEARAVHERSEADAAFDRVGLVVFGELLHFGVIAAHRGGNGEKPVEIHRFMNELSCGGGIAFVQKISPAQFFGREANGASHLIEVALHSERALRRAESAESAVRRGVGSHSARIHAHIRTRVRARGVNRAAGEHDGRKRGVGAAIEHEIDIVCDQFTFPRHCRANPRARWMALGSSHHIFRAVVDKLHRLA